ncbi:MAG TPA: 3-phosphoshikimate 1-carboxyvinyltransferase [Acidimicrobiales bacterium]|nr:3-phosphoshikimate 1-carboxyvinyltransferase [Acidimicrobiales bacterium]
MTPPDEGFVVEPLATAPDVTVQVPGSKSLTNRALVCAAMAEGTSILEGALRADDTEAMIGALGALGIRVAGQGSTLTVEGAGGGMPAGPVLLDARLSGTTARFLAPLVATGAGPYRLDAAPPMRARPMGPLVDSLRTLGAEVVEEGEPRCLPLVIGGGAKGGRVELPGHVSSQFLSGLLLAGPLFPEGIDVTLTSALVSVPYVEMTRWVMRSFGVAVDGTHVPPGTYAATRYAIEPDATAASYFLAAAAITGGRVTVRGLHQESLQGDVRFADVLARMGARVEWRTEGVTVTGPPPGGLHGVTVDLADLSDTAQTLAAAAAFATGPTTITGIGFIRRKETDRIADTVRELQRAGIDATEDHDGFTVRPRAGRIPQPARIQTYDDHRMAMSFALLGLVAPGIEILDPGCVAKTYPDFFADLDQLHQ